MATKPTDFTVKKRVIWRIVFRVIDGIPQIKKEISFWNLTMSHPVLMDRWDFVYPEQNYEYEKEKVTFVGDRAIFKDGYIMVHDLGLEDQLFRMTGKTMDLTGISDADLAENVGVAAEVRLTGVQPVYPIFHYPQEVSPFDNYLALSVNHKEIDSEDGKARKLYWRVNWPKNKALTILGQPKPRPPKKSVVSSDPYYMSEDFWHRVAVKHKTRIKPNTSTKEFVFECLADSVPLGTSAAEKVFKFSHEPKTFCIGRVPDQRLPGQWHNLTGEIRSLVFDPNDSCPTCRGQ